MGNRPHITPSIMQVYQFMRKYQDKLPGFNYVLDEILENQIFNVQNLKLTAMVTLDFENYIEAVNKAQEQFFLDRIFKLNINQGFDGKGQTGAQGKEPDFSALQPTSAMRAFENTS